MSHLALIGHAVHVQLLTCTGETVAFVAGETRAEETAQRVGALCEHVARSILALVFICKLFKKKVSLILRQK